MAFIMFVVIMVGLFVAWRVCGRTAAVKDARVQAMPATGDFKWQSVVNEVRGWKLAAQLARWAMVGCGLLLVMECFTVVPAGHVGVMDIFGHVSDTPVPAGFRPVNPLARIVKMSVRTQEAKEVLTVPSKEGLVVPIEASLLYHLDQNLAPMVYRTIGTGYLQVLMEPQFRSVIRDVTAGYEAKSLYTSDREVLEAAVTNALNKLVRPRGIVIEGTPLRNIDLPKGLKDAIEMKLSAEQASQQMRFVLQKESQEAERKRIEAQGIADFQTIVTKGISEPLLRWKGIEATEKLAMSHNTKVVIVGAGKSGLPLILNTD